MKIPGTRAGFWFALALGVVIGAALAILFMPHSGSAWGQRPFLGG
jgi:hypothetical protein